MKMPVLAIDGTQEMWDEIPEHLQQGLADYLDHGRSPGSFLTSCLSNDLLGAVTRAHPAVSIEELRTVMRFLSTCTPGDSWGNADRVRDWTNNPLRVRELELRFPEVADGAR
jgi:hypothetical protein